MNKIIKATHFASIKHRDQRRKNRRSDPYVNHPIALANVLTNEIKDVVSDNVVVAAILHDTIEDTETTELEILTEFGPEVLSIVKDVSDDKSLKKDVRKKLQIRNAKNCSYEAKLVKLADKICNLRDFGADAPVGWSNERCLEYFYWAKEVVDQLRGTHKELETIFYKEYVGHMRYLPA